ncbi:hypothetical protein D6C87_03260 [Aureobasidium pullulans]|uniref:Rhodopsin domain-containing protein n=1 Tax=Aureobasidium pullulans TaxID=5580 RepID=A0AB38LYP3_AURPU|nr:hypothetical protein D6C94_04643 [Aureobasidium pullulans]THZ44920.1 hypothetical protein D6C87_03260 [Aureobasidium pullulans]
MVQWGGYEGTKQVIIVSVFLALSFVVLSLRLFTRVIVTRNYGLEDLVITAAFCFSVAQVALVVVEVQHGQGLAQSALSADDVQLLKKTLWKLIPTYLAGLTLTKLSILLQYMRLFKDRAINRVIIGMLVFVAAYGTWSVLGALFICFPVKRFWDQTVDGHCMIFEAKWFSDASVNILTDLILLSLPMPYLKGLNLPRRQKAGLIAVFALGGFVCLVSMARLRPLYVIATANDVSQSNGPAAWLSSMEVNVGIICASLPSLRAITLRTCCRRTKHASPRTDHAGWWQFDKQRPDDVELEGGQRYNMSNSGGSAITKMVTIQTDTQERRDSGRKLSIWSLGNGGIFDGGAVMRAWVNAGK